MSINRLNSKSDKFLLQEIANNTAANGTTNIDKFAPTNTQSSLQAVGIYGENTSNQWQSLNVDSSGNLKVDATIDTSTLATSANQTNGAQKSQILGNTVKDGSGTSYHALMDSAGKLQVSLDSVEIDAKQDDNTTTDIRCDNNGRLYAGIGGYTTPSDNTTFQRIKCDSNGVISVDDTTANGHLNTISGDTTSIDGKITQGSDSTLASAQQVGCYAYNGTSWKQIHSTTGGNLKVSLEELNGSATGQQVMADSIPVVIASNQSTVDTSNTKITQGEGNISGGGNGLQQVLIYGKDQSGNLDPIDVDSQGHLKITIQDEEKALSSTDLYTNVSLTANTPSTAQDMNDKKNIQIVGKTTTSTAKIGLSFQASGTDYYTNPEYAALYHDGVDYQFSMTVQGVGANSFKIYPQTNASNVYLTYHLF